MVPLKPPVVMLPMSLFKEVTEASDKELSFHSDIYNLFVGRYTHVGVDNAEIFPAIRSDLTKGIGGLLPLIQDETRFVLDEKVYGGSQPDWKAVPIYQAALQLVAHMSGRVFVGLPLSREKGWVDSSINYALDCGRSRNESQRWNPILRPWVQPYLPAVRRIKQHLRDAKQWMSPLVAELISQDDKEKSSVVEAGSRGAWISWLLKYLPADLKTAERIGMDQMIVHFHPPFFPPPNLCVL